MGKPQVCKIYTVQGKPDNFKAHAKHADVVVWIPETPDDLIDIIFLDKTPFGTNRLTANNRGDAVGAFVVVEVAANTSAGFPYTFSTNGIHAEAEPEIIVDGGGGGTPPPQGKK